jgi:predicted dehydrogenase
MIRVAIVGAGMIGSQLDETLINNKNALTHAGAFSKNLNCQLVALCDKNESRAADAAAFWGVPQSYSDVVKMLKENSIDMLVVSTSSNMRLEIIENALLHGVKYFVIEKPLATTFEDSRKLVNMLDAAGAKTIVNFSRRWDCSIGFMRDAMNNEIGTIQRAIGFYGKGLVNNGSHMIDLVSNILRSNPIRVRALGSPLPQSEADWSDGLDQAIDAQVIFANDRKEEFSLNLLATDQSAFTCFNLQIIGCKGMYEYGQGGREVSFRPIARDQNYADYTILGPLYKKKSSLLESMEIMVAEAIDMALGKINQSSCDAHCAIRTALAVDYIKKSREAEGQWVNLINSEACM